MSQLSVKKVAVLGAGVMGAQIAALFANQKIPVYLYDLRSNDQNPSELSQKAINHLSQINPPPLVDETAKQWLIAANFDDLTDLNCCDLVIEAISEKFELKSKLYQRITPFLKKDTWLVTNTSGISIESLASCLSESQNKRFCGVHFFNPPRYLPLVEVIPTSKTNQTIMQDLIEFLENSLAKKVVLAKDTPNFIANRIGIFSLLITIYYADKFNLDIATVDALTGIILGRPKSATFRTIDVVGLDTFAQVIATMHQHLKDDPWHGLYQLPQWMQYLIDNKALGQKTKQGIYRKTHEQIEVFNPMTLTYESFNTTISPIITDLIKQEFSLKNLNY